MIWKRENSNIVSKSCQTGWIFKRGGKVFGSYKYMCKKDEKSNLQNTCNPSGEKKTTADEKDRSAVMWSKSEKQEQEKTTKFSMHQNSNPPPPPMVSNCISKGYCPKEIEEPYPLITFCTLKHIPEQGGGGGKEKKKREKGFLERIQKRKK